MKRFGCAYIVFPMLLIIFGVVCLSVAKQMAPATLTAAREFASDPSCSREVMPAPPPGACTTTSVTILTTEMRKSGGMTRTPIETAYAFVRFPDGTLHDVQLNGDGGDVFVYSVPHGARARLQTFHGTIVRIVSGTDSTETIDAPDVNAEVVYEMPWVAKISIALAVLIVGLRIYSLRRSAPAR